MIDSAKNSASVRFTVDRTAWMQAAASTFRVDCAACVTNHISQNAAVCAQTHSKRFLSRGYSDRSINLCNAARSAGNNFSRRHKNPLENNNPVDSVTVIENGLGNHDGAIRLVDSGDRSDRRGKATSACAFLRFFIQWIAPMNNQEQIKRVCASIEALADVNTMEWGEQIANIVYRENPDSSTLAEVIVRLKPTVPFLPHALQTWRNLLLPFLQEKIGIDEASALRDVSRSSKWLAAAAIFLGIVQVVPIIKSILMWALSSE